MNIYSFKLTFKFNIIFFVCLFYTSLSFAQISYLTIVATGTGSNIPDATIDAVSNAIGQVNGMTISTSSQVAIAEISRDNAVNFQQEFSQKIDKMTKGMVKSFSVLEAGFDPSNRAVVTIEAVIPKYNFSEQLKRLRLAVEPFAISNYLSNNPAAIDFAENISSSLETYLTQTRKFAMINRRNLEQVNVELNRLSGADISFEETVRLGLKVGADYIVLATLKDFSNQVNQQTLPTGRIANQVSIPVAIDLRVIDIATGQIKYAYSYSNKGRVQNKTLLAQYSKDIAAQLGGLINNAIYPILVVSTSHQQVMLNQGGETVAKGKIYNVFSLGQKLFDPYTKEFLGNDEQLIGQLKVVSVNEKTSIATIESGIFPEKFEPGSLLVRIADESTSTSFSTSTSIGTNAANNSPSSILTAPALLQLEPLPLLSPLSAPSHNTPQLRTDSNVNKGDQNDW
jgi:hypothetical protein